MDYPLTRNYLQRMSRDHLRELCRERQYRVVGYKSELINRILKGDQLPKLVKIDPLEEKYSRQPALHIDTSYKEPSHNQTEGIELRVNRWIGVGLLVAFMFYARYF